MSPSSLPVMTRRRVLATLLVLALLAGFVWLLCLLFGSGPLDLGRAFDGRLAINPDRDILFGHRLPRVALAALVGAALGATGATFQALLRNPLADPFILGVSGGAAMGGSFAIALGLSTATWLGVSGVHLASFAGAFGALVLVHALSRTAGALSAYRALLVGVVFNAFAAAVILFVKTAVTPHRAQEMLFWLAGTLALERYGGPELALVALPVALGLGVLLYHARDLDLLCLGDEGAQDLGVAVARVRRRLFLATSLMVGAVVAVTGLIGFVGLIVPHAVRLIAGPGHRLVLPAAALVGAAFLPAADLVARLLFPVLTSEAPVGAITAFLGAPAFVWVLVWRHRPPTGGDGGLP